MQLEYTDTFRDWLDGLRDLRGRALVQARIERLAAGHPGDFKPVGDGVLEMRIAFGPGYRVYYSRRGRHLVILLAGGDKSTQAADIAIARSLARHL
jgi:putative addiction module killer protein